MGANRTVLVTGSSGYVGRRLVARLAERGTPVRALVHRSRDELPAGVEAVQGDITDAASLAAPARASTSSSTSRRSRPIASRPPGGYDRVNAEGAGRAGRRRAQRRAYAGFVHLAGIDTTTGTPGPYLAGRRRGEAAVLASGIESVAILRPSIMFGGPDAAFVKALARLVKLAPAVPVPGDGSVRLQMVWVEDVVTLHRPARRRHAAGAVPDRRPRPADLRRGARHHRRGPRQAARAQAAPAGAALRACRRRLLSLLPSPPLTPAALELFASDNVDDGGRDRAAVRLPPARLRGARAPRGPLRLTSTSRPPRDEDLLEVLARRAGSCAG